MSTWKLQKLCYYALGWSLVFLNNPLFEGTFEAWAHGPVNRQLWDEFIGFGISDVSADDCNGDINPLNSKQVEFLERVWDTYGEYNSFELENLTLTEEPWIRTRGNLPSTAPSNRIIPLEVMDSYFRSLYFGDGVGE